jgi:hypothetical protein
MDPNSPGGSTISKQEKDKIYKAIKEALFFFRAMWRKVHCRRQEH